MTRQLLALLVAIFLLTGCDQKPKTIVDLNGNTVNFQDYRGKWVVINYWASWCGHCLKELPKLNRLYETNEDKIIVFGVNYDQLSSEQLKPLVKKLNIKFPILTVDPAKSLGLGNIEVIPVIYLLDPDGEILQPMVGEQAMQTLLSITGLKSDNS